jgi:Fe-S-cluster containining protein
MRYFDCEQCGGKCCKFIIIPITNSDEEKYYRMRGPVMDSKRFGKLAVLPVPCANLTEDGKCNDYENRPNICKEMNAETMFRYCIPSGCKYDTTGEYGEDYGV